MKQTEMKIDQLAERSIFSCPECNGALWGREDITEVVLQPENQRPALTVQLSSRLARTEGPPEVRTAMTDITHLKSVQQQLVEIGREQETFCYSISHDLRMPLITISNLSTLLLSEFAEKLDPTASDFLQRIHFATLRMDQLLSDLLEYSRISRSDFQSSSLDVEQIVDDVIGQHQGVIETTRRASRSNVRCRESRERPKLSAKCSQIF